MENKKNYQYLIPVGMAVFMIIGLFMGNFFSSGSNMTSSKGRSDYQKMNSILEILDRKYVDSIDSDALFEKAIADMLHDLDPHSNYIPAKDLKAVNEQIQGKFGGVGVRFFIIRDTICITNVLPYSPAEAAGLQAGDRIIKIDGEDVALKVISNDDVMTRLKGVEGTDVKLVLQRGEEKVKATVRRGSIPIQSVVGAHMINDEIGFLKITNFSVSTSAEFQFAAQQLRLKGMKKLIIDVRNNGGGVLSGAVEIADEFFESGKLIVSTKGSNTSDSEYRSSRRGSLKDVEVAILINENSASASEILAGAIQDNDRGLVIGRRSFGKGLVQEDVLLQDGSNLRLTIARYYTPTGRCIQKEYDGDIEDYYNDHADRYENGELYELDSTLLVDSLKFTTKGGKTVYGGGGIMPDIFVPYDSTGSSWYYTQLRYTSSFTTFAFDYVRDKRSKWKNPSEFQKTFRVTDQLLSDFTTFVDEEYQIALQEKDFNQSKENIRRVLKGEIARQLWVENGYYKVMNPEDNELQKAVKSL